jgi:hypothetical protein
MREKVTNANVLETWTPKYPEVVRWLGHLQQKRKSAYYLSCFCESVKLSPPELLALKEKDALVNPPPNEVEKLLDEFVAANSQDFTNAQRYNISIAVKSFFKWSYRDLAKASGKIDLKKVKPYNALSKEGLRKLWQRALNPRDRALIPFVTSTGIAKETLSNLLWAHLEVDWESKDLPCINIESELLKGHGHGKYAGVKQVTFLTPEAKRELIIYKEWIEQKLGKKLTSKDNIWLETYKPYEPMSYGSSTHLIRRLSKNAEVPFSWHDARRWINTNLEQIGISSNWARKIRGRKVKGEEAPYSQPAIEQLRAKFREAVPLLEFIAERAAVPKEIQERMAELEEEQRKLRQQYRFRSKVTKPEEIEKCENGEYCQKIVSEAELGDFLSQDWRMVATLPSGKIVIQS